MKMAPIIVVLIFLTTILIIYSIRKPLDNNLLYMSKSPTPSAVVSPTVINSRVAPSIPISHEVNAHTVHGTVVTFEYPTDWQQVTSPIQNSFLVKPAGDEEGTFMQINDFVEKDASVSAESLARNSISTESSLLKRTTTSVGGHQAIEQVVNGKNGQKIEAFVKDVRENNPSNASTIISGVQHIFMDIPIATNSAYFENSFNLMLSTFRYTY